MEYSPIGSKNIVIYSTLSAGGDIIIGDLTYQAGDHFDHSTLFLRIEKDGEGYFADLFLKTRHAQLRKKAEGMLHERIVLQIPESLFKQVNDFQASRRSVGENMRSHSIYANPSAFEDKISQLIHDHFFAGDIGFVVKNFLQALEKHKISELLLVVSSPDERIRNLPWEMVLDRLGAEGNGVLQMQGFGLVRSGEADIAGFNMEGIRINTAPLKMLFITALPEDLLERQKNLELEDEQKKLIDSVGALEATGDSKPKMVIEFLDVASLGEIKKALQERDHDVLHISGHGGWLEDLQQGILYLENDEGDRSDTNAQEFAETLHGLKHLKLVVLSACETAVAGDAGTADVMAASGLPAVLAMRFSVTDEGAKAFTTAFYKKLVQGNSITEAMAYARGEMLKKVEQELKDGPQQAHAAEWFAPVLYLNQYMERLVDHSRYIFPDEFYTHGQFLKEKNTRLIGSGFIGRKKQRIKMRRAFQERKHICLFGMGGMGKTTLAEAFARNFEHESHRIIIWRGENEITEWGILNRIVEKFKKWDSSTDFDDLQAKLDDPNLLLSKRLQYLIDNCLVKFRIILIFDNFEDLLHLVNGNSERTIKSDGIRELLSHLLQNAPENCHLLFTSRYKIEGLPIDIESLNLAQLSEAEQYRLMNFSPSLRKISIEDRQKIYKRLDGLPRAFEYLDGLATHDPNFSWDALESQLGKVEAGVFADLMLGRIYELLDAESQKAFLMASIFFTRSPVEALVSVTGNSEIPRILEMLLGWSLCFFDVEKGEFEIHALTREWVSSNRLMKDEDRKRVALGAGFYFWNREYEPNKRKVWDGILAADYYEIAEDWELFLPAIMWVQEQYLIRGLFQEVTKQAVYLMEFQAQPRFVMHGLNYLGLINTEIGEYIRAEEFLSKSWLLAETYGLAVEKITVLNNLGRLLLHLNQKENAKIYLIQARTLSQEVGDKLYISKILNNLALLSDEGEDRKIAIQNLKASLEFSLRNGDLLAAADTRSNLATFDIDVEDYEEALSKFTLSLETYLAFGNLKGQAHSFHCMGVIFSALKNYDEANKYLEQSYEIRCNIGDQEGQADTLLCLGVSKNNEGLIEDAIRVILKSRTIYLKLGSIRISEAENCLAIIMGRIGKVRFEAIVASQVQENQ